MPLLDFTLYMLVGKVRRSRPVVPTEKAENQSPYFSFYGSSVVFLVYLFVVQSSLLLFCDLSLVYSVKIFNVSPSTIKLQARTAKLAIRNICWFILFSSMFFTFCRTRQMYQSLMHEGTSAYSFLSFQYRLTTHVTKI